MDWICSSEKYTINEDLDLIFLKGQVVLI